MTRKRSAVSRDFLGENEETIEHITVPARVVSGWVRDSRFLDSNGQPAVLPVEGNGVSFNELVRHFSGDMPVRAVLDELDRVGVIDHLPDGPSAFFHVHIYLLQVRLKNLASLVLM